MSSLCNRFIQIPSGIYRHYTHKLYHVLGTVIHTETNEHMILYSAIEPDLQRNPHNLCFVRPVNNFHSNVNHEGKLVPRFEFISTMHNKIESIQK